MQAVLGSHVARLAWVSALAVMVVVAVPRGVRASDPLFDEDADSAMADGPWDPVEPLNRGVFRANLAIDHWFFGPITRAYAVVVPAPARRAIRRALGNLDSPAIFVNDLLQGSPIEAMTTLSRFGVNSTVGVAGLFDPASALGLPPHFTDFGDTLALAGVPSGPYLMLPIVGPTTARDGTGFAIDFAFRPTTYLLTPAWQLLWIGFTEGGTGLVVREEHQEALEALEASAVDYYAALKNAWWQTAQAEVQARRDAPLRLTNLVPRLWSGALGASSGEVVHLAPQRGDQGVESVALEH